MRILVGEVLHELAKLEKLWLGALRRGKSALTRHKGWQFLRLMKPRSSSARRRWRCADFLSASILTVLIKGFYPRNIPEHLFFVYTLEIFEIELNMSGIIFLGEGEPAKIDNCGDTALRLDCLGYSGSKSDGTRGNNAVFSSEVPDDGCRLVLGLGPTPSSYSDDYYSIGINKNKRSVSKFGQDSSSEDDFGILKLGLSRYGSSFSSQSDTNTSYFSTQIPIVDEGSTSAKKSGGYMPSLLLAPRFNSHSGLVEAQEQLSHHSKKCKFTGCLKGARGASGLCIAHGGGQRCQKHGCNKGAESRTAFCKAHGGGKRCQNLGCTKSAEGKTDYCIAHGGGRRCSHSDCTKAARGRSGLCIRHGGGKRCTVEGCTRSAEGQAGLCISHGGGRRCQYLACNKGAQGSTNYCKAHGGGKRCVFTGCTKGAEGSTPLCKGHGGGKRCLYDGGGICPKSVHGGTDFCVAHGGGKRCSVSGCTKSARGRTDCCVRHGGGKRCRFDNCEKSAQGSTDFCKAHGGGKRCSWGQGTCEKFARGKSGLCAAHGSLMQEKEEKILNKSNMIGPGLFRGLVPVSAFGNSLENDRSSSGVSAVSDCIDSVEKPLKRSKFIPPQVLVPQSMKSSSSSDKEQTGTGGNKGINFVIPEGRVHGGGLMSLLGGNLQNAAIDGI
ncbi:hypothetical protein GIB67_015906 [Kingdonia uniflora]|uniref:WRKY19-like zinc finger domain-containing protein n=1 Tax=Kingdonia uniflora TaxID=39325 RepID=A0A7J7P713_9MAGN|nr:hypothetical protein GIB67_015906 [Kingdonia uniflora]